MNLVVTDRIHLTEFRLSDQPAVIQLLNDRAIYDQTLRIPHPYTQADVEKWFAVMAQATEHHGRPVHWAIRQADDSVIGGIGYDASRESQSHRAEIGYWLGRPFRGQGIMTTVVRQACAHAFEEFGWAKIMAYVFAGNGSSARVLEKCGFQQEGFLRKHFLKEQRCLDAYLYALIR